jgi:type IV pilus assembly protein PilY1
LVVTGITPDAASLAVTVPPLGWYLLLTAGERVISRPLAVGGLVDFLTYKPDDDLCSYGGSSFLYADDYLKGIAPTNVAIRSPGTTNGETTTGTTVTIKKGILLGPGAPPTGEAITIPPPKEGQEQLKKKIQVATGVIVEAENTPVLSTISKVVHWLKK